MGREKVWDESRVAYRIKGKPREPCFRKDRNQTSSYSSPHLLFLPRPLESPPSRSAKGDVVKKTLYSDFSFGSTLLTVKCPLPHAA